MTGCGGRDGSGGAPSASRCSRIPHDSVVTGSGVHRVRGKHSPQRKGIRRLAETLLHEGKPGWAARPPERRLPAVSWGLAARPPGRVGVGPGLPGRALRVACARASPGTFCKEKRAWDPLGNIWPSTGSPAECEPSAGRGPGGGRREVGGRVARAGEGTGPGDPGPGGPGQAQPLPYGHLTWEKHLPHSRGPPPLSLRSL